MASAASFVDSDDDEVMLGGTPDVPEDEPGVDEGLV